MIRISRLTDYGIVLMRYVAAHPERPHNAAEIAVGAHLPLPTVSKLLRLLARERLLVSHRGAKGGYELARPSGEISLWKIINALEGPVGMTVCTSETTEGCEHESLCPVEGH
ncbi:MAG: Rrf2 family transcriptional regulator [Candidatus Binatia bacterium]